LPVSTIDEQFVTETRFNSFGIFASATVSDNGRTEADFQRAALDKLLNPIPGVPRYSLLSQTSPEALSQMADLRSVNFQTAVERRDLIKGTQNLVFDNTNFGRLARANSLIVRRHAIIQSFVVRDTKTISSRD
jgi:hypothetical protein